MAAVVALLAGGGGLLTGGGGLQEGGHPVVPDVRPGATSVEPLDVPFLAQGRLLCGGAAAAMVERFWGKRGVYSDAYAELVRPSEGGIRTTELSRAVEERGYRVEVIREDPGAGVRALARGVPAILLIEGDPGRYHYVVLVGWQEGSAVVHDPLVGPERRVPSDDLEEMHGATGHWTMIVEPRASADSAPEPAPESAPPDEDDARRAAGDPGDPGDPDDPDGIDRALAPAMAAIRAGDFDAAERLALEASSSTGEPTVEALAWRITATARYRSGRPYGALDAWNRLGEPPIDLVVLEGTRSHRWSVLADRLPFGHGDVLTGEGLRLAERRLAALPGIESARVDYRPLVEGGVELRGFVVEESRWPSRAELAWAAAGAVVDRELTVGGGPWLAGAERVSLRARWSEASDRARVELAAPAPPLPGVTTVGLEWGRERYGLPEERTQSEEWLSAGLGVGSWVASDLRLALRVGVERWTGDRRRLSLRGSALRVVRPERLGVEVEATAWTGDAGFERLRVRAEGMSPAERGEWRVRATGAWATSDAPRAVWEGAGTGRVREPLLRGRRLVADDVVAGPAFGPRLVQGSLERAFLWRIGAARAGFTLFGDVARAWGGGLRSRWLGSWGGQAELEVAGRRFAVSAGTGSGDWVVSMRVRELGQLF